MTDPIEPQEDLPAFEGGNIEHKPEGEVAAEFDKEIKAGEPSEEEPEAAEETKPEEPKEEPKEPAPYRVFKTQGEFDDYVQAEAEKRAAKTEEPKEEKKPLELFKGYYDEATNKWVGEAPKDWNDFATKIRDVLTPEVAKEVKTMTAAERAEFDKINQEYDEEYNAIAAQGKLPALDTKEGQEANKQISTIGASYGITSITKAYDLWSKIPKDQGGGLDYQPAVDVSKQKLQTQKQKAGLIGSSRGTPSKQNNKQIPYNKLHFTNTDDLVDERLKQE